MCGIRRDPRPRICGNLLQGTPLYLVMSCTALQRNPPCSPNSKRTKCSLQRWLRTGYPRQGWKERNILNSPLVWNNVFVPTDQTSGGDNAKKNECLRTKTSRKNMNLWFPYTVSQLLSPIFKDITPPCHWDRVNCSYQEVKQDLMERICSDFNELRTRDFQPRQIREGTD